MIEYKCSKCQKSGVKLWRQYNTIASRIELLCVDHALIDQNVSYDVREDGKNNSELGWTDQIEWLMPAVPTDDNETFWGYTSVPSEGVTWWVNLPLR